MGIDLGRFRSKKNDEWVDWLADDPVPASIRGKMRAKAVQEASRPVVRRVGEAKTTEEPKQDTPKTASVSINISIPHFKLKKPAIKIPPQVLAHKEWFIGGAACIVVAIGITSAVIFQGGDNNKDTPAVLAENNQKADFDYSLPKGETSELDGEARYSAAQKTVSFKDSIGGVEIIVSQQQLPESFGEVTEDKVKKIAEDFSATKAITTANPTAYLGTNEKGPQSVVFYKNKLLVLIKSTNKIDEHDWAEYITNLK